jgi:hypothetical protein
MAPRSASPTSERPTCVLAITGHKTGAIFDRYNIVSETDLRDASVRVTDYVADREPRENHESQRRVAPIGAKRGGAST